MPIITPVNRGSTVYIYTTILYQSNKKKEEEEILNYIEVVFEFLSVFPTKLEQLLLRERTKMLECYLSNSSTPFQK